MSEQKFTEKRRVLAEKLEGVEKEMQVSMRLLLVAVLANLYSSQSLKVELYSRFGKSINLET